MNREVVYLATKDALSRRNVDLIELAKVVYDLQSPYEENLTLDDCYVEIDKILRKREVGHAVITGIEMDELAENNVFSQPLQKIVETDQSLYGVDEILALSIVNIYGSIAYTNFGYLDKTKPGIIGEYNNKESGQVHTFLDDILCAIAASACSRLAFSKE